MAVSRKGAAVLVADPFLPAAEETAALVRAARVTAWALQVDVAEETDLQLLAARARDLGGMDLLVHHAGAGATLSSTPDPALRATMRLTQLFVEGLAERRGRRDGTPAVVNVWDPTRTHPPSCAALRAGLVRLTTGLADPASAGGARVMAVIRCCAGCCAGRCAHATAVPPPQSSAIVSDRVAASVITLLSRGAPGEVLELPDS